MEILQKIQSTKLGIGAITIGLLYQMKADPWTIVVAAGIYMICDAAQKFSKK